MFMRCGRQMSEMCWFFFFQAEDGIRDLVRSRGLGDVYKRQDDGLIQLSLDGGKTWKSIDGIAGVPERSYVHQILSLIHI